MKDPTLYKVRSLLPELFTSQPDRLAPGGICTPESGCAPVVNRSHADISNALTGSTSGLPAQAEPTGRMTDSETRTLIADLLLTQKPKR